MLTTLRIAVLGALLAALALPGQAVAAPPPNDNRADSVLLPDFPSNVHGTTAEATVERLDPQVSRCGRIESTVWYRVEAAPDGTIVATAQAAAGLTPVLRIYRRGSSSIQELDCATSNAGGKAVVSSRPYVAPAISSSSAAVRGRPTANLIFAPSFSSLRRTTIAAAPSRSGVRRRQCVRPPSVQQVTPLTSQPAGCRAEPSGIG